VWTVFPELRQRVDGLLSGEFDLKSVFVVVLYSLVFYYYKFLLGYIHYTGGIHSDNSN
jgi:hypothetical protein